MSVPLSLSVNGKSISIEVDPRTQLVDFIRNKLALTGTHVGCDTGQCGACTILIDGNAVKACTILAVQASGSNVTTIEGLAANGELHPMQAAFKECHGLQCGFCTPGMVMSAIDLVERHPNADEATIRAELATRNPTVPMPLATASETRSMKLLPPAYDVGPFGVDW